MTAILSVAVAPVAAVGAVPAAAEQGGSAGVRFFERLDMDGDGAISREEARALEAGVFGDRRFERRDRDGDRAVTEAQMIEAAQERVARRIGMMFARLDANGDGRVQRAELESTGLARFDRVDADGDGRVSLAEVRARWTAGRDGGKGEASTGN